MKFKPNEEIIEMKPDGQGSYEAGRVVKVKAKSEFTNIPLPKGLKRMRQVNEFLGGFITGMGIIEEMLVKANRMWR